MKQPLRILMVTKTRQNRGNYMRLYPIASHLASIGCEVTLLFAHEFKNPRVVVTHPEENLTLVALPTYTDKTTVLDMLTRTFVTGNYLLREVRRNRFDVIHVCSPAFPDTWLASVLGKIASVPLLVDVDDLWGLTSDEGRHIAEAFAEELLIQHGVRMADRVLAGSELLKNRYLKASNSPIEILWNGIEPDLFKNRDKKEARSRLTEKFNLDPGQTVIAAVLDGPQMKFVAGAIEKLEKKGNRFAVLAPGYLPDSYVSDDGTNYMRKGGIYRIKRMPRDNFLDVLAGSDMILFTMEDNEWEKARPLIKIPEFLASGTPLISFPVGETRKMLDEAGYGEDHGRFYFQVEPESIAESIDYCLQHKDAADSTASSAREYVLKELTWDRIASKLLSVYSGMVTKGPQ